MKALRDVGLADAAGQLAGTLSLGNQRRLEIARAIVSRPRVVLLDEPVSGVSEEELKGISDLLIGLNSATGATLLIVEHNMSRLHGRAESGCTSYAVACPRWKAICKSVWATGWRASSTRKIASCRRWSATSPAITTRGRCRA
ncbi:ATP-binding cassette domain-containing protein [Ramlibacter sp.]|uniref:ATP-binding cassette domain-containing protein n=1 Tax=Ramlibacter sp. TaxID=1917967 RepID=UPI002FC902EE